MTNNSKGRKISDFIAQSALPSDAQIIYISGGINYRILLADFVASLGVTGTIVQDGDPLGTPILNVAGAVNNIRNLEPGSGIKASVSPQNGATIEHDFLEDTSGTKLVIDLTAAQPKFRSLVAGAGINISSSNGQIQIAESGAPVSAKTVIVNDINDFPAAVAGVITLAADTEYRLLNDISTANRFVFANNCVISGSDNIVVGLIYTGSGKMVTSLNANWTIKNLTITAASGTFVDFDGTGAEILQLLNSVVIADTFGTISDFLGLQFSSMQFTCATDGFTFSGTNGVALIHACLNTVNGGTLFDLGVATFNGLSIKSNFSTLAAATFFLDGAAASANITADNLATVFDCHFFGSGTPLTTITDDDNQWQFSLNNAIEDTHNDALMSLVNNATETVISVSSTPVLVAGTWNTEHSTHFTIDANGRAVYDGLKDQSLSLSFSVTATVAAGSNKQIALYIAKNGTEITNTEAPNVVSSGSEKRISQAWIVQVTNGDYFEIFAENQTDTVNIIISHAAFRITD